MKKLVPFLLAAVFTAGNAQAIELNVLGGLTGSRPATSNTGATYTSRLGLTFGATVDFNFIPMFAIETGLLNIGYNYRAASNVGGETDISNRAWEVPVLLRYTALPIFDFGAGFYFQHYGTTYGAKSVATGVETTGNSWEGAGLSPGDFGLKLGGRAKFPIVPLTNVVVELDLKRGLKNLASNGASYHTSELDLLTGISFGF